MFLKGARTAATVTDGVNGLLVEHTEEAYADAIAGLLADRQRYDRIAAAAREQLYIDWDTVVDRVYNKYLEMIEAKKKDVEAKKLTNVLKQAFLPDVD